MKAAMAMETASQAQGETGAGMGLGMGFMMPAMFADALRGGSAVPDQQAAPAESRCPGCGKGVPREARFCPHCGGQIVVFQQCAQCNSNLPADARFCFQCGRAVEAKPLSRVCLKCGYDNLFNAAFCNQCGERISQSSSS
jgi:predicted amidophosphoribosyltransferase